MVKVKLLNRFNVNKIDRGNKWYEINPFRLPCVYSVTVVFNLFERQLINRETDHHDFLTILRSQTRMERRDTSISFRRAYLTRTHIHRVVNIIHFLIDIEQPLSRRTDAKINSIDPSRKAKFGSITLVNEFHDMHLLRTEKRILLSLLSNRRGPLHFHRGESEWNASIFLIGASVFDSLDLASYIRIYIYISNYSSLGQRLNPVS